jgi:hypothetical protein
MIMSPGLATVRSQEIGIVSPRFPMTVVVVSGACFENGPPPNSAVPGLAPMSRNADVETGIPPFSSTTTAFNIQPTPINQIPHCTDRGRLATFSATHIPPAM